MGTATFGYYDTHIAWYTSLTKHQLIAQHTRDTLSALSVLVHGLISS